MRTTRVVSCTSGIGVMLYARPRNSLQSYDRAMCPFSWPKLNSHAIIFQASESSVQVKGRERTVRNTQTGVQFVVWIRIGTPM